MIIILKYTDATRSQHNVKINIFGTKKIIFGFFLAGVHIDFDRLSWEQKCGYLENSKYILNKLQIRSSTFENPQL